MADVETMPSPVPIVLKVVDVAPVFKVTASTVRRWIRTGEWPAEIPVQTIGGVQYVKTVDVEAYAGRTLTLEDLAVAS